MEKEDKSEYTYNMTLTQLMVNFYGYFGYKKDVYFIAYAKIGNGIALISEQYKSEQPLFDGKYKKKYNDICYAAQAGLGIEWYLLKFFSIKVESTYNYILSAGENISYPLLNISGNIYFDTPFFLNM